MNTETRVWSLVGVVIAVITMAVPVWVTYDIYGRGDLPEKQVELHKIGPINPLSDLSPLAKGTKLELTIGNQIYDNFVIEQFYIKNTGKSPIIPSDFFENLRVSVKKPWTIVAIKNRFISNEPISLEWQRLTPATFEAKPFLLNPGDNIGQTVYLTNLDTSDSPESTRIKYGDTQIDVTARIVNLKRFTKRPSILDRADDRKMALVYLSLSDVLFLLFVANLFLYWYARSIEKSGIAKFPSKMAFCYLILFAILSYSTAEVITYYLFGGDPTLETLFGRRLFQWEAQIQNWLILIVHIIVSLYLYRRIRKRQSDA